MKFPFKKNANGTYDWFQLTDKRAEEIIALVDKYMDGPPRKNGEIMNEFMEKEPQSLQELLFALYVFGIKMGEHIALNNL